MSEAPKPKSLVTKLAEVMGDVERVAKNGHNAFHNYDYATEADIVAAVRAGLASRHVMLVPVVKGFARRDVSSKGGSQTVTTVEVLFTFLDGDSDGRLEFPMWGEGADPVDKGFYKALTGATKYALLKLFLIPTGDDPETDSAPPQRSARPARPARQADAPPRDERPAADLPTVFPNFGSLRGMPIRGAPVKDLEWYRGQSRKSLADPEKARFHAEESARIRAIDAELERQRAEGPPPDPLKKPATVVDVAEGETEEHAKMRSAGGYYAQAVALGKQHGLKQEQTGKWLREKRDRASSGTVTEADVAAYRAHLAGEPPPDMKLPGQREPGAEG